MKLIITIVLLMVGLGGCTTQVASPGQPTIVFEPGSIIVQMQVGSTTQPAINLAPTVNINGAKVFIPKPQ